MLTYNKDMDNTNAGDGISVHAGFPNPANDKSLGELNLNTLLIQNSASTFLFRIRGDEWQNFGIFDNDIAIIDRALNIRRGDLVICASESGDSFLVIHARDMLPDATAWGVVTAIIHQFRHKNGSS